MALTDEQIASMMQKHITCKSVLVSKEESTKIEEEHLKEGWELANKVECHDKIKLTFRKAEKI